MSNASPTLTSMVPRIFWRHHDLTLIKGTTPCPECPKVDLSHLTLPDALIHFFPQLKLSELGRLSHFWKDLQEQVQSSEADLTLEAVFKHYGLRWTENLNKTLSALRATPQAFQTWVDQRQLSPHELSPLLSISAFENLQMFLSALGQSMATRQAGSKILELGIELFLMDRATEAEVLPKDNEDAVQWSQRLTKLRYPNTVLSDETHSEKLKNLSLPKEVKASWVRFGDRSGVELKVFSTSSDDLKQKLEKLISRFRDEDVQNIWIQHNS